MGEDAVGPVNLGEALGDLLVHLRGNSKPGVRDFEVDAQQYGPLNRRPLGIRSVPLDRIAGSVGRARELGPDFLPVRRSVLTGHRGRRFDRIYTAVTRGQILPPVELYKLGYWYYVLDGNHRVAAMKKLTNNDGEIDANVTQFIPVGDTEAARVFIERREFETATGLEHVGAGERGHYPMLLKEIEDYRAELSAATNAAVPLKRAASDWYALVWMPRAEQIRRTHLRRLWPEKRTADIYCYITEHQRAEAQRRNQPFTWEEALADFVARHPLDEQLQLPLLQRILMRATPPRPSRAAPMLPPPPDHLDLERYPQPAPEQIPPAAPAADHVTGSPP